MIFATNVKQVSNISILTCISGKHRISGIDTVIHTIIGEEILMKNTKKNRKGFTLIELIVVIAILAILAAVAVPNFIGLTTKAQTATEVAAAAEYANAINIFNTLNPDDGFVQADLEADISTDLGTLNPTTEFSGDDLVEFVLARIEITGGIAMVDNKEDIVPAT